MRTRIDVELGGYDCDARCHFLNRNRLASPISSSGARTDSLSGNPVALLSFRRHSDASIGGRKVSPRSPVATHAQHKRPLTRVAFLYLQIVPNYFLAVSFSVVFFALFPPEADPPLADFASIFFARLTVFLSTSTTTRPRYLPHCIQTRCIKCFAPQSLHAVKRAPAKA